MLGIGEGESAVDLQGGAGGVAGVGLDEGVVDALGLTGRERFTNPAEYLSLTSGREWHPSSSLRFSLRLPHHAGHWMQQKWLQHCLGRCDRVMTSQVIAALLADPARSQ